MLLLLVKVRMSPAKKPPMLTVAVTSSVLSESLALAPVRSETGVLLLAAGLLVLSVKVAAATGVIVRFGALSRLKPSAARGVTVLVAIDENNVGAPPIRLPL